MQMWYNEFKNKSQYYKCFPFKTCHIITIQNQYSLHYYTAIRYEQQALQRLLLCRALLLPGKHIKSLCIHYVKWHS